MKKIRLFSTIAAIIMVLSFSTTVFATGSQLKHNGTSSNYYMTSDYVSQKTDKRLTCVSWSQTANYAVSIHVKSTGALAATAQITGGYGNSINNIYSASSVRSLNLKLANFRPGYSASCTGTWNLYAS